MVAFFWPNIEQALIDKARPSTMISLDIRMGKGFRCLIEKA
jgi:hypothetical protein